MTHQPDLPSKPDAPSDASLRSHPAPPPGRTYGIQLVGRPATRLCITERKVTWVPVEDVVRIQADDDYVVIHAAGKRHMAYVRLKALMDEMDPGKFVAIHRSHAVNLDHVRRWWEHPGRRLAFELSDGTVLVSSRRLRGPLHERLLAREMPRAG